MTTQTTKDDAPKVAKLTDLRLHPRDEADLRWLFVLSDGDLGMKSGLGAQLERMQSGEQRHKGSKPMGTVRDGDDGIGERMIEAATKAREITDRLKRIARPHRRVLEAHYGLPLPRSMQAKLGAYSELAAVVLVVADRERLARKAVYEASGRSVLVTLSGLRTKALKDDEDGAKARARLEEGEAAAALVARLLGVAGQILVEASTAYRGARKAKRDRRRFDGATGL